MEEKRESPAVPPARKRVYEPLNVASLAQPISAIPSSGTVKRPKVVVLKVYSFSFRYTTSSSCECICFWTGFDSNPRVKTEEEAGERENGQMLIEREGKGCL